MRKNLTCMGLLLFAAAVAGAQGLTGVAVGESSFTAVISLPGDIEADLEISFEKVVGLTEASLGVSAELVNPLDLDLLSRMPDPDLIAIAGGFPVMVTVEPPASGALSFSGITSIHLYTHNLTYSADCPFRLFAAEAGGPFSDITNSMAMGSYRTHGTKGGFSEFLIVADPRPVGPVIEGKFGRTQDVLDTHGHLIDPDVLAELQAQLDLAHWTWAAAGDVVGAIREVESFAKLVVAHSGGDIPDVWRASGDLVNVAGELRAAAGTLRFSLNLQANASP